MSLISVRSRHEPCCVHVRASNRGAPAWDNCYFRAQTAVRITVLKHHEVNWTTGFVDVKLLKQTLFDSVSFKSGIREQMKWTVVLLGIVLVLQLKTIPLRSLNWQWHDLNQFFTTPNSNCERRIYWLPSLTSSVENQSKTNKDCNIHWLCILFTFSHVLWFLGIS